MSAGQHYTYKDRQFDSEQAMVLYLLDEYRCIEGFAAQYLRAWKDIARDDCVRGDCGRFVAGSNCMPICWKRV